MKIVLKIAVVLLEVGILFGMTCLGNTNNLKQISTQDKFIPKQIPNNEPTVGITLEEGTLEATEPTIKNTDYLKEADTIKPSISNNKKHFNRLNVKQIDDALVYEKYIPRPIFSTINTKKYTVWVGDSRFVGMAYAVDGVSLTTELVDVKCNDNIWICKVGSGFNFLKNTVPELISKYQNIEYMIINVGVNDSVSGKDYAKLLNEMKEKYNFIIYFVSIGPVNDELAASTGYLVRNSVVVNKNNEIKNNFNNFIDVYSKIKDSYVSTDGVRYDTNTYKNIYELILEELQ